MPHCISSWKDENKSLPTLPSSSFAFSACEECLNETAGLCKSNQQNLHNVDMVCMRNFRLLLAWQQKDRYQVFFFLYSMTHFELFYLRMSFTIKYWGLDCMFTYFLPYSTLTTYNACIGRYMNFKINEVHLSQYTWSISEDG